MLVVIVRGLLARKLRLALTAFSIVLGVSMISGTFVLTDKMNAAFSDIFKAGNQHVDVAIWKKSAFGSDPNTGVGVPFDVSFVARVQGIAGVRQAVATISTSGFLVNGDKKLSATGGAPSILASAEPSGITAYTAVAGAFPVHSGEVTVNEKLASDEHLHIGQRLRVSTVTGLHPVTIAGIVKFGNVTSIGGATIVLGRLADVQRWANLEGKATRVDVAGKPGVSAQTLAGRVRNAVSAGLTVQTGAENAAQQTSDTGKALSFLNYLLLTFGFVAVFVGAFIIFNTYSITVAQRTHEFGVLRLLGASNRQTLQSVLGEALIVGVVATAFGVLGGVGFAALLSWLMNKTGMAAIPSVGTIVKLRTVVWAVSVGLGVTLVAALIPALRASRVTPIAALRGGKSASSARRWLRPALLTACLGLAVPLLIYGTTGSGALTVRLLMVAGGALFFFLAVALAMAYLVSPSVAVLGVIVGRLGGAGKLATRNTTRNPSRTAATAAALMIGTGLIVFVAILGSGLKVSLSSSLDRSVHGDLLVSGQPSGAQIPAAGLAAVRAVSGVAIAAPLAMTPAKIERTKLAVLHGVDPSNFAQVYTFDWVHGSDALVPQLGSSGALVEQSVAVGSNPLYQGSSVHVQTQTGGTHTFRVLGIYKDPTLVGGVIVSNAALRPLLPAGSSGLNFIIVKSAAGANAAAVQSRVEQSLKPYALAKVQSNAQLRSQAAKQINQSIAIFYVLLAMSVIISVFGMVNTLVLSVYERTREIGMLRAVGTTRGQLRRLIRYESVLTAVLGALIGVAVGVAFGYVMTRALSSEGLTFAVPLGQVMIFTLLAVVVGVLAAILPARHAARLDVLRALQYE
ncbi:MAG: putative transport system permease protein [Gaiellaceae bacterium]|jgi:putative ABC transport system permease protein|nr:putative transport system permease protein [Gaiellaceae bacterium]